MYGYYGNFNAVLNRDLENKTGRIHCNDTNHLSACRVSKPLSLVGQEHRRPAKGGKTTKQRRVQSKYVSKLTHMY